MQRQFTYRPCEFILCVLLYRCRCPPVFALSPANNITFANDDEAWYSFPLKTLNCLIWQATNLATDNNAKSNYLLIILGTLKEIIQNWLYHTTIINITILMCTWHLNITSLSHELISFYENMSLHVFSFSLRKHSISRKSWNMNNVLCHKIA